MTNAGLGWIPLNFELRDTGRNIQSLGTDYLLLGQILATSGARVDSKIPDIRRDANLFLQFSHLLEVLVSGDAGMVATAKTSVHRDAFHFLDKIVGVRNPSPPNSSLYGFLINNAGEAGFGYVEMGTRVYGSSGELRKILPQLRPENAAERGAQILLKYLRD